MGGTPPAKALRSCFRGRGGLLRAHAAELTLASGSVVLESALPALAHKENCLCLPSGSVGSLLGKATSTADYWSTVNQTNKQTNCWLALSLSCCCSASVKLLQNLCVYFLDLGSQCASDVCEQKNSLLLPATNLLPLPLSCACRSIIAYDHGLCTAQAKVQQYTAQDNYKHLRFWQSSLQFSVLAHGVFFFVSLPSFTSSQQAWILSSDTALHSHDRHLTLPAER